jgi:hypothetical protein
MREWHTRIVESHGSVDHHDHGVPLGHSSRTDSADSFEIADTAAVRVAERAWINMVEDGVLPRFGSRLAASLAVNVAIGGGADFRSCPIALSFVHRQGGDAITTTSANQVSEDDRGTVRHAFNSTGTLNDPSGLNTYRYADPDDIMPAMSMRVEPGAVSDAAMLERVCPEALAGIAPTAVDVGAGTGRLASALLGHSEHLVAVEPDVERFAVLQQTCAGVDGGSRRIELHNCDGDALQQGSPDRRFALTTSIHVLAHISPLRARTELLAMRRLIADGGLLIIVVPTIEAPENRYMTICLSKDQSDVTTRVVPIERFTAVADRAEVGSLPTCHFTSAAVGTMLREVGLTVLEAWTYRRFAFEAVDDGPAVLSAADTVFVAKPT